MELSSNVPAEHQAAQQPVVHEIDWDVYASQYDLLATNNPCYRENIETLRSLLPSLDLPSNAAVCDIGAGTGNFICALANDLPEAQFVHLDADPKMNDVARKKYESASISNVNVVCCSAAEAPFDAGSFDLALCINALYAMHDRDEVLSKIRRWLKPGGRFFIIDFGRRNRMWDWSKYIFGNIYKEKGLVGCLRFLVDGLETIKQNRRGSKGQAEGVYWLHSTEEFQDALENAGFQVDLIQTCYRDYCDLAVCRVA